MINPLSQNNAHLEALCSRLDLGAPGGPLKRVYGGLQHTMWRLDTAYGSYAIKQLSEDADLADPAAGKHFNTTESLAAAFAARGVPAVFAHSAGGDFLQLIDGAGYLVYGWREGTTLGIERVSEEHALVVARMLAGMHRLNLAFPDLEPQDFDVHSEDNITMVVEFAGALQAPLADTLQRALPTFLEIVDAQPGAIGTLERHLVACHGDLDQKNVLWDSDGKPALIDWESARRLNPTYEALLEALNWSGIWSRFEPAICRRFIAAYEEAGGVIEQEAVAASYHCILGDWLYWLMHNVGRCLGLENVQQRAAAESQVAFSLAVLQRIMDHVPQLLSVSNPPVTRDGRLADV